MTIKINQNLSPNIICSWKINKRFEPKTNYNVLSVVFFFKYEAYKDKSIYITGLSNLISDIKRVLPDFRIRIYHDNTVKETIKDILKDKSNDIVDNVELYEYDIPVFREEKNKLYHKGAIGSFIRFLPLFDIEHHKVNKCIIFDIDNTLHKYFGKLVELYDRNNLKISYRTRFCYIGDRIACVPDKNIIKYPLIASFIYQSIQVPYNIISDFLENLYIKDTQELLNLITSCNLKNKYEYGIDELYMNHVYLKYFYKNNITICPIPFNHIDIIIGIKKYSKLINKQQFIIFKKIINNFFKIMNINIETQLKDVDNTDKLKELLKKFNLENKIINIYKDRNKIESLKKYISNELNKNYNLPNINLLLNCILSNLKYINPKMINLLIVTTGYDKNAYTVNTSNRTISFN